MLLLQTGLTPEEAKTIGIVMVTIASFMGALLYPIAKAYARRLEGGASTAALREELAEINARLEVLQHGQERIAELEGRIDFTERLLAQSRERDQARLPGT